MKCKKCNENTIKNGRHPNGSQRYYCKMCRKSYVLQYSDKAYEHNVNRGIVALLMEGVGIRSTSRLLNISKTTVISRIKKIASEITKPIWNEKYQNYELDEMRVVVGYKKKEAWITYAINRETKEIINFIVGARNKRNISVITKSVLQLYPKMVYTDQLRTYNKLIPKKQHNTAKKNTNTIERNNLTLRTHLKRLSRKTICFSKNFEMLKATLKIYFWSNIMLPNYTPQFKHW